MSDFVNKEVLLHTCACLWMKGMLGTLDVLCEVGLNGDHDESSRGKRMCATGSAMGHEHTACKLGRCLCWGRPFTIVMVSGSVVV